LLFFKAKFIKSLGIFLGESIIRFGLPFFFTCEAICHLFFYCLDGFSEKIQTNVKCILGCSSPGYYMRKLRKMDALFGPFVPLEVGLCPWACLTWWLCFLSLCNKIFLFASQKRNLRGGVGGGEKKEALVEIIHKTTI
jgi:hypothetical protein